MQSQWKGVIAAVAVLLGTGTFGLAIETGKGATAKAPAARKKACPLCKREVAGLNFCERDGRKLMHLPGTVSEVKLETKAAGEVVVSWSGSELEDSAFLIERRTGKEAFAYVGRSPAGARYLVDRKLSPETDYVYRVRATNPLGNGKWSGEVRVATLPLPPTAPDKLSAKTKPGQEVELSWEDRSANERDFVVERKAPGGGFATVATLPKDTVSYVDKGLTEEAAYSYRVRAVNSGGPSEFTTEVSVTILPRPPAPPINLIAEAICRTRLRLDWTDEAISETEYHVERKSGTESFKEVATLEANSTTFVDFNAQADTAYIYRLRTGNAGGLSAYSKEIRVTTAGAPEVPNPLEPNDPELRAVAVPSRLWEKVGVPTPVTYRMTCATYAGKLTNRASAFYTLAGKKLFANPSGPQTGTFTTSGTFEVKGGPSVNPQAFAAMKNVGVDSVIIRMYFRGEKEDGTPVTWSVALTKKVKE